MKGAGETTRFFIKRASSLSAAFRRGRGSVGVVVLADNVTSSSDNDLIRLSSCSSSSWSPKFLSDGTVEWLVRHGDGIPSFCCRKSRGAHGFITVFGEKMFAPFLASGLHWKQNKLWRSSNKHSSKSIHFCVQDLESSRRERDANISMTVSMPLPVVRPRTQWEGSLVT